MVQEDQEGAASSGLAEAADDVEVDLDDGGDDDDGSQCSSQLGDACNGPPQSRGESLGAELEGFQ